VQIYLWKIYFTSKRILGAEALCSPFTHKAHAAQAIYLKEDEKPKKLRIEVVMCLKKYLGF
jgi:hypothetical protein